MKAQNKQTLFGHFTNPFELYKKGKNEVQFVNKSYSNSNVFKENTEKIGRLLSSYKIENPALIQNNLSERYHSNYECIWNIFEQEGYKDSEKLLEMIKSLEDELYSNNNPYVDSSKKEQFLHHAEREILPLLLFVLQKCEVKVESKKIAMEHLLVLIINIRKIHVLDKSYAKNIASNEFLESTFIAANALFSAEERQKFIDKYPKINYMIYKNFDTETFLHIKQYMLGEKKSFRHKLQAFFLNIINDIKRNRIHFCLKLIACGILLKVACFVLNLIQTLNSTPTYLLNIPQVWQEAATSTPASMAFGFLIVLFEIMLIVKFKGKPAQPLTHLA